MLSSGVWAARKLKRARILLLADTVADQSELIAEQIAEKVGCGRNMVQRFRQHFANGGLEAALEDRRRTGPSRRLLDSKAEQQEWLWPVPPRLMELRAGGWNY